MYTDQSILLTNKKGTLVMIHFFLSFFPEFIKDIAIPTVIIQLSEFVVLGCNHFFVLFSLVYSLTSYKYIFISTGFYCYLFRTEVFDWNNASNTPFHRTQSRGHVTHFIATEHHLCQAFSPPRLFRVP